MTNRLNAGLPSDRREHVNGGVPAAPEGPRVTLIETLWMRRWTVVLTVLVCMAAAIAYLTYATRIYTSRASLLVEENAPKVLGDQQGFQSRSDNYLHTQAAVIRSLPIVQAALDKVNYRQMKTFAKVEGDPVVWLWRHSDFQVDVGKKDDIISVSMDSPYPQEAAAFVNAVVEAYVNLQSEQKRVTGGEMTKILAKQKQDLQAELDTRIQQMLKFKRENGALSFHDDKGNIIVERLVTLSGLLTAAESNTLDLRTQYEAAEAVLKDPAAITAFVQSEQMKQKDWGDKEYDQIRDQLQQYTVALNGTSHVLGDGSRSIKVLESDVNVLRARKAEKERAMADAYVRDLGRQLAAAREKEQQLRDAFDVQQKKAMELNAQAAEYARLEAELDHVQKQYDVVDGRMKEVSANSQDAGALNVRLLEPARAEERPSKPKKSVVLAIALLAGSLLGTGLGLLRDWMDRKLRSAEETTTVLGMPVIATVPRISGRRSLADRGQLVERDSMSQAAETYRTLRTAIHFGTTGDVRTVLLTSPAPGDGKSTTASNLAIALAQAGHRTVIIDADLRKPVQHKIFEVDGSTGICDVLARKAGLKDVLRRTAITRLFVLPCGTIPRNPSELIASKGFAKILESLAGTFDRIVIDSPPVMAVTDARIIAATADATVLVVRMNKSDRKLGALAVDALHSVGANLLGWVANDMPKGSEKYYGGYGYYGAGGARHDVDLGDPTDGTEAQDGAGSAAEPRHEFVTLSDGK